MSAGKFSLSLTAAAQMALMSKDEKALLNAFFTNESGLARPNTQKLTTGGFVSRVGSKRVLWRSTADHEPEIVSIVDESYADRRSASAHATG